MRLSGGAILVLVPLAMALLLYYGVAAQWVIIIGLIAFALLFAINSSLHSFLIVDMADKDGVSLDVGFYYMAMPVADYSVRYYLAGSFRFMA